MAFPRRGGVAGALPVRLARSLCSDGLGETLTLRRFEGRPSLDSVAMFPPRRFVTTKMAHKGSSMVRLRKEDTGGAGGHQEAEGGRAEDMGQGRQSGKGRRTTKRTRRGEEE